MLNVLAFVPMSNVIQSFEKLLDTAFCIRIKNISTPIFDYFSNIKDIWSRL